MDLNLLKNKLKTLQTKNAPSEKKDYSSIYWKPTVGKQQIRIVPSLYTPTNPFTEVKIHYGIGRKVQVSPLNYGEKDPIAEFANLLRSGEYDKEKYSMAKKLDPKVRIFAPVIVRGEEDKGVRLWQFGKQIHEELLSLAVDEEIGDYTDIVQGRDLNIETVGPESTGTEYNKSSVRVRLKTSPLSDDAEQVELWTKDQPNPLEQFKRFTYDEMKSALGQWLDPDGNTQPTATSENAFPPKTSTETSGNYKTNTSNDVIKQKKEDTFDNLFNSDSKGISNDDLPF
jgi:hypothetical protein